MKTIIQLILILMNFSLCVAQSYVPNQLIVKLPEVNTKTEEKSLHARFESFVQTQHVINKERVAERLLHLVDFPEYYVLTFDHQQPLAACRAASVESGLFESVSYNHLITIDDMPASQSTTRNTGKPLENTSTKLQVVPNDSGFFAQWYHHNDGSFTYPEWNIFNVKADADMDSDLAWDIEQGSKDVIIAVLDAGYDFDFPDLKNQYWINENEIPGNGLDDDNNGYIDDYRGWDFHAEDNDATDEFGHGVLVSNLLGGEANNQFGYSGMAPGCTMMPIRVIDAEGSFDNVAEGMLYAAANGAKIVNLSLGNTVLEPLLEDAINTLHDMGVLMVAAAGNSAVETKNYPAAHPHVMAIGASNAYDELAIAFSSGSGAGSNYGEHLSVVAPGDGMWTFAHPFMDEGVLNGTSLAAPLVSGIAGLLLSQDNSRTAEDLQFIIESTAEDQVGRPFEDTPGFDKYHGHGRVNAFNALNLVVTGATSASDAQKAMKIYPNPAREHIFISVEGQEIATLSIANHIGVKQVFEYNETADGVYVIQTSHLEQGAYLINVTTGSGVHSHTFHELFIKK